MLDGEDERENTDRPSRNMRLIASDGDMNADSEAGDKCGDGRGGNGRPAGSEGGGGSEDGGGLFESVAES